jgi:hypothetical protein
MTDDLVQTPNGTFVTREDAEAAGLDVPAKRKRKTPAKTSAKSKTSAKRTTKRRGTAAGTRGKRA